MPRFLQSSSCSGRKSLLLSLFRRYQCRQQTSTTSTTTSFPKKSGNLFTLRHCHTGNQVDTPPPPAPTTSPFQSNILRLLTAHIHYRSQYFPPHRPVTEFNGFTVEDRPGEQWITLRGKSIESEHIKIEATMFDGSAFIPMSGAESSGENVRLHISLLVDIWKGGGNELLEFVCSAWPDSLEIQKVYVFRCDNSPKQAYMGPNVKGLNRTLANGLYEFLKTRGVNDDLSLFLHEYIMNKDKAELIHWFGKVKEFIKG